VREIRGMLRRAAGPDKRKEFTMARITVEDCLGKVSSRFELVMLASMRVRQLRKGAKPCVESDNREIVVALREIAANKVRWAVPKPEPAK